MKNQLETKVIEIGNDKKAKGAIILGGALAVVGASIPREFVSIIFFLYLILIITQLRI